LKLADQFNRGIYPSLSMAKLMAKLTFVILLSWFAHATTFAPIPIKDQIKSTHAIIDAEFLGSSFKKDKNGEIQTVASFKIYHQVGLGNDHFINYDSFSLLIPGGEWEGLTYHVYGAPSFKKGERAVLLLDKTPFGYQVLNLSLGKLIQENEILKSTHFPVGTEIGSIKISEFNELIGKKFGRPLWVKKNKQDRESMLVTDNGDSFLAIREKRERKIASEEELTKSAQNKEKDINLVVVFFIVLLLIILVLRKLGSK
jgi:hypothetical protein